MSEIRFGSASAGVVVSDDMAGHLRQALNGATRGAFDVLEARTVRVFDRARSDWPERTGRSRRDLRRGVVITGDTVDAFVGNNNSGGYVYFIKSGGVHVWSELVRRPMNDQVADIVQELGEDVVAHLSTGRGA